MVLHAAPEDRADDDALPLALSIDRRRQVGDQVYDALKAAIVSVRLPPGAAISENRICRHFGVSRTPVRSAIIRLVEDELIDVYPQQGSFVAPIRLANIRDSHFVRKALELAVLREAAKLWNLDLSSRARTVLAAQRAAMEAGDIDRFHLEDDSFHHNFASSAGLEGVWHTIQGARVRIDRLHRLAFTQGRMPNVLLEHEAVLDALDAGHAEEAAARLEFHVDRILDLLGTLRERFGSYFAD
jgi:DNA-binding GntR family transcriptional regulator